jgi:3-phenylpropionate/trans-cinnamate dioxygenase ferredoxin reductase subunit
VRRITVVGASLAGYRAAQTLRREGFDGELVVVGGEPERPYDRPPLSKRFLAGQVELADISLERGGEDLRIDWRLGTMATAFDAVSRRVTLASGEVVESDGVILACGARPRSLPGDPLAGVHVLRAAGDSAALRGDLLAGPRRLVVIGAGFIGAEVAATARGMGLEVTIVETLDLPLARVLPPALGQVCADLHRDHGVDLRLGVGVSRLRADGSGRVAALELADGSSIEADVVLVGIGVVPNTEWLQGSGLTIDDGVVCDETTLAAPGVVAAGDVARWTNPRFGESARVEHWDNVVPAHRRWSRLGRRPRARDNRRLTKVDTTT